MTLPKFKTSLVAKLASIAVHAEEFLSADGHAYDKIALQSLLADPEVKALLSHAAMQVFLPRKRNV